MEWLPLLIPVLLALMLALLTMIGTGVREVHAELRLLNGRLLVMETRLSGHLELDELRFNDLKEILRTEERR